MPESFNDFMQWWFPGCDTRLGQSAQVFMRANPDLMKVFEHEALQMAAHYSHFGIGFLTEIVRHTYSRQVNKTTPYRINNNHRASIARWLIYRNPHLERRIELRTMIHAEEGDEE